MTTHVRSYLYYLRVFRLDRALQLVISRRVRCTFPTCVSLNDGIHVHVPHICIPYTRCSGKSVRPGSGTPGFDYWQVHSKYLSNNCICPNYSIVRENYLFNWYYGRTETVDFTNLMKSYNCKTFKQLTLFILQYMKEIDQYILQILLENPFLRL